MTVILFFIYTVRCETNLQVSAAADDDDDERELSGRGTSSQRELTYIRSHLSWPPATTDRWIDGDWMAATFTDDDAT